MKITISRQLATRCREIEPRDILRANRMMYAESLLALVLGLAVRLMLVL